MAIENALAGVAVKDLDSAVTFYETLIGKTASRPMAEVAEWTFPNGGALQLFRDADRAGASSVTLAVNDIGKTVGELGQRGVAIGERTNSPAVRTARVADLDGNQIVLAQALGAVVAR
jgi:predicted enzyme related to lactoylglutathione lyase